MIVFLKDYVDGDDDDDVDIPSDDDGTDKPSTASSMKTKKPNGRDGAAKTPIIMKKGYLSPNMQVKELRYDDYQGFTRVSTSDQSSSVYSFTPDRTAFFENRKAFLAAKNQHRSDSESLRLLPQEKLKVSLILTMP